MIAIKRAKGIAPGLCIALLLAGVSSTAAEWIGTVWFGGARSPVSPVTLALLLGLAFGTLRVWPAELEEGVRFASVTLLRFAIVILGLQLSLLQVAQTGLVALPLVVATVTVALLTAVVLARALRLQSALGLLVAVGTAICGVSAIAATGPAIRARREEVAVSIAVITLLGLVATLLYPLLVPNLLGPDPLRIGLFLGVAIHDTSQVTGAALMVAQASGEEGVVQTAIVTKLLRNATMVIVLPLVGWWSLRGGAVAPMATAFPRFLLGFLTLAALRTLGDLTLSAGGDAFGILPPDSWGWLQRFGAASASALMVVALAALGMGTPLGSLRTLGLKPFVVGLFTAVAVALLAWGLINTWLPPVMP